MIIGYVCSQERDIYYFDEISNYLDIQQRMIVGRLIRNLLTKDKYIILVDHDLSLLDYICDFIYCLYGEPSCYGITTSIHSVSNGINIFLSGYDSVDNMRFRSEEVKFIMPELNQELIDKKSYMYDKMKMTLGNFTLIASKDYFSESEITILLGKMVVVNQHLLNY